MTRNLLPPPPPLHRRRKRTICPTPRKVTPMKQQTMKVMMMLMIYSTHDIPNVDPKGHRVVGRMVPPKVSRNLPLSKTKIVNHHHHHRHHLRLPVEKIRKNVDDDGQKKRTKCFVRCIQNIKMLVVCMSC